MNYLKAFFKWIFRRETLGNAIFSIDIAKSILTDNKSCSLKKNESVLRKLEIAQEALDRIQGFLPNKETAKYVEGINKSEDKRTWGDFTARISKDKHGSGRDGVDLGIKTDKLGVPIEILYDPKDGSAKGKIGPFGFNI